MLSLVYRARCSAEDLPLASLAHAPAAELSPGCFVFAAGRHPEKRNTWGLPTVALWSSTIEDSVQDFNVSAL